VEFLRAVRLLRAYRWTLFVLALSSLAVSAAIAYSLEDQYVATALVMAKPHERLRLEQNRVDKETGDYPVTQLAPVDAPSRTYIEIIKSRYLAERVVRTLHLDAGSEPPPTTLVRRARAWLAQVVGAAWDVLHYGAVQTQDPLTRAVRRVQRDCAMSITKDTYLFDIRCGAADPVQAAAIANASADVFIKYTTGVDRQESGSNRAFLEGRLRETEAVLAAARRALTSFKDSQATFSLQEEYANHLKRISELETYLERMEAQLAGLLREYTHERLARMDPKVQSMLAEKARLQQSLARLRERPLALPDQEKQLEDLRLRVKAAEDNYTVVTKALTETRIQEQSQVTHIRVVSPATPPAYPARPVRIYLVAGAVAVTLLLGVLAVFFADSIRPRVRSTEAVERAGLRVLATIPRVRS
jgi:uncharacterized protein involved in exopolysaccharide biosynthesis